MSKKCSECSFENEDKAKFCRGCGAALSAAAPQVVNTSGDQKPCPSCQSLNKPGAKFCLSCGYKFVDIGGAGSPPVTQTQPRVLPTPAPTIVAPPVDAPTAPSPKPPPQPVPALAPAIPTLSVVVPATPPTPQPLQQQATTANVISSAIESSKTKVSPRPVEKEVFVAPLSTPPDRLRPAPKPLPELIARKTEAGIAENAPPSKIKTQIVLGTAVVVVAVLAGGGYWYLNRANTSVETTAVRWPRLTRRPALPRRQVSCQ